VDRRDVLTGAAAGVLTLWVSPRLVAGQTAPAVAAPASAIRRLTDRLAVVDGGGANVLAFSSVDGLVLVDAGAPKSADTLMAELKQVAASTNVHTLFNTHHHLDQTGNNEVFAAAGARIIAHERARQWMSTDYWIPAEDRYEKARAKAGSEQIDYGYLPLAHTSGDSYVFFRTAMSSPSASAASPLRDPALDYFTGGWIGGRVDAMDALLKMSNGQTRIVPAYGPVMTRAELKAERDMMEEVRGRLFTQVREGDRPKDMLQAGVLNGLPRTWQDPEGFLYAAAKGLWAHHNKLDPNVV